MLSKSNWSSWIFNCYILRLRLASYLTKLSNYLFISVHFFSNLNRSKSLSIFKNIFRRHSVTKPSIYLLDRVTSFSSLLDVSRSLRVENLDMFLRIGLNNFFRVSFTFFIFLIYSALFRPTIAFFLFSFVSFLIWTSFFMLSFLTANSYCVLFCLNFWKHSLSSLSFLLNSIFCILKFLISFPRFLITLFWLLTFVSICFCSLAFPRYYLSSIYKESILLANFWVVWLLI